MDENRIMGLKLQPQDIRDAFCQEYVDNKINILNLETRLYDYPPISWDGNEAGSSGLYGTGLNNKSYYGSTLSPFIGYHIYENYLYGNASMPINNSPIQLKSNPETSIKSGYGIIETLSRSAVTLMEI